MITIKTIAALQPGSIQWDDGKGAVPGFGARRQKGRAIAYFLKYRTADGRQRWHTIGRHGAPWTPDMARAEARRLLGDVTKGNDPAGQKQAVRKAATVAELCDAYVEASESGRILTRRKIPKKESTLATDKGRIERHIKPLLGKLKVAAVTERDVERFRDMVAEGATRARIKDAGRPRAPWHSLAAFLLMRSSAGFGLIIPLTVSSGMPMARATGACQKPSMPR
jgi:Arm DNA-binding domain/Phage integrase, N-terminal SAM-like domain